METDKGCLRTQISNKAQGISSLSYKDLPTETTLGHIKASEINMCTYNRIDSFAAFLKKIARRRINTLQMHKKEDSYLGDERTLDAPIFNCPAAFKI